MIILGGAGFEFNVNLASKLFYIGIVFHVIFEPIKSFIINLFFLYFRNDYFIVSKFEKYCLNPLPLEAFERKFFCLDIICQNLL